MAAYPVRRHRAAIPGTAAGDTRNADKTQSIDQLTQELAYEFWHRMLFARFLAEDHLLMHPDGVAVSLDLDFVDPDDAPGVGTPVRGGVTYREAHLALEIIADSEAMVSLEVVEINPVIDLHNQTALLGVEMVLSGLGKKIL